MRSSLFQSIPLVVLVGCTIHTGPGAGTNNPPPPPAAATPATPAPTVAATPTPAPTTTAAPAPTATAPAPLGTTAAVTPGGTSGVVPGAPGLRAPVINKVISFGGPKATDKTVLGEVFEIGADTKALPSFANLKPIASIYTSSWDVAPRKFEDGFPGVKDRVEWFAIRWAGKVKATKAGVHVFKIKSDDGARLTLDGQMIVNNDGLHPPTESTGQTLLNAGEHDLELTYFQGPKYEVALQVWVTVPGTTAPKIFSTTF